jgi:hypothetical protein
LTTSSLASSSGPPIYGDTTSSVSSIGSLSTATSLVSSSGPPIYGETTSIASSIGGLSTTTPLATSSGPPIYGETTSITSQAVSSLATSASSSLSSIDVSPQSSLSSSGLAISSQSNSNALSSSTIVSSASVPASTTLPDASTTDLPSAAPSNSAYGSPSSVSISQTGVDQPFSSSAGPESYPDGQVTVTLSPTYSSVSTFVSQDSPIPTCGAGTAAATVSSSGDSSVCQDPYGNTYNVTYGSKQYVGKVTKRAVTSNVNECLLLCNLQTDCVAANYVGNDCTLLRYAISCRRIKTLTDIIAARSLVLPL